MTLARATWTVAEARSPRKNAAKGRCGLLDGPATRLMERFLILDEQGPDTDSLAAACYVDLA